MLILERIISSLVLLLDAFIVFITTKKLFEHMKAQKLPFKDLVLIVCTFIWCAYAVMLVIRCAQGR